MKAYPTIPRNVIRNQPMYVFDKLDGSNIRVEWSKKKGFYKFGTRKRLLGDDDPILSEAKQLFLNKYGDALPNIFIKQRWDRAIAFFEFYGPNSFAGTHENETHDVTLFDVNVHRKGILDPKTFVRLFEPLGTASLLYHGNINEELINSVKDGTMRGMTFEGVVCKTKGSDTQLKMCKIKSNAWLYKLQQMCGDDKAKFEKLA